MKLLCIYFRKWECRLHPDSNNFLSNTIFSITHENFENTRKIFIIHIRLAATNRGYEKNRCAQSSHSLLVWGICWDDLPYKLRQNNIYFFLVRSCRQHFSSWKNKTLEHQYTGNTVTQLFIIIYLSTESKMSYLVRILLVK
jgi:hypothetical protein